MNKHIHAALAVLSLTCLIGCAGLPDTDDEVLTIETTPPMQSAHCIVSNSYSSWDVWYTPSTISIIRDSKPLSVTCRAPGFAGAMYVKAHPDASVAFIGNGSDTIAETSDALPPDAPYQGNTTNKLNGIFAQYPGTIIVPMSPTDTSD
jgi:hypothetical protein